MNKVSKQLAEDLLTLVLHARTDIKYREGGTFNDGDDNVDEQEVAKVERAIEYLNRKFISQHYVV